MNSSGLLMSSNVDRGDRRGLGFVLYGYNTVLYRGRDEWGDEDDTKVTGPGRSGPEGRAPQLGWKKRPFAFPQQQPPVAHRSSISTCQATKHHVQGAIRQSRENCTVPSQGWTHPAHAG